MAEKKRGKDSGDRAVKIDSELFVKISEFISRKENKLKYSSMKQFIDIAVLEKLERESNINEEKVINEIREKEKKISELNNRKIFQIKKEVKVPTGII